MIAFNCTKAAHKYFTITENGKQISLIDKPVSKKISDDKGIDCTLGLPPRWQWQVQARKIFNVECIIFMDINTRFAMLFPFVEGIDYPEVITMFMHELCDMMFAYADEHLEISEEEFEKNVVTFQEQHSQCTCIHRHDQSTITHISNYVEDFMVLVETVGTFPDLDEMFGINMILNNFPRTTIDGKKGALPLEEFFDGWLQHVCLATKEERTNIRVAIFQHKEKTREVINDELAAAKFEDFFAPEPEIAPEPFSTSGNVVSLDAFRSKKIH